MDEEKDLVAEILGGDAEATQAFISLFKPRLLRASVAFLGLKESEGADMVQDTFMVALPRLKHFKFQVPLMVWLRQICMRQCYARLRERSGVLVTLEDDLDLYMQRLDIQRVQSENLEVQKQQKVELLRELIKQLTPSDRQIIQLRNVNGMTYGQISLVLDIALATVVERLVAAREQIRIFLDGPSGNGSPNKLTLAA